MEKQPETLICPFCGNVNSFTQEKCFKCNKSLVAIREAMGFGSQPDKQEIPEEAAKPVEPSPPMPELSPRQNGENIGKFINKNAFLIRGMGERSLEIASRFFKQLADRNIQNLKLSLGSLAIKLEDNREDTRKYYFAERDLGEGALSIMAVQIAPVGTDLFVEWRNYTLPSLAPRKFDIVLCIIAFCFYILPGFYYLYWWDKHKNDPPTGRKADLEGFQYQDNQAFQLSVRAALEESIDLAGISKSFIQNVSEEDNKDKRVI